MRKLLPLLFLWSAAAVAQLQTPIAIRNLPPATAVSGSDLTIDDQFGSCPGTASITCTRVASFNQVLAFIEANYSGGLAAIAPFTILGNGTGSTSIPYALSASGAGSLGFASVGLPAFSGTPTAGNCVKWLSATTIEDAGTTCGAGGGGNVSNFGTPTQYQLAGWVTSTTIQGIGPGVSGQALVSNGISAFPSFTASLAAVTSVNGTAIPPSASLATYTGSITATHCAEWSAAGVLEDAGSTCGSGGGGGGAFSAITSGSNTTAAMLVGTGASLGFTGSGIINADQINGIVVPSNAVLLASNSSSQLTTLTIGANLAVVGTTLQTSQGINAQVGTSYTVHATDEGGLITFNNAASVAVTLPQAGTTGFLAGFSFDAQNLGAGTVTITPTTSTINGAATLTMAQNTGCTVSSDGGNYQISACTAVSSGGGSGGSFSAIGSGTNTTATMMVGSGASITTTGTGVVNANELAGSTLATYFGALPVPIGNTSAAAGTYTYSAALGVNTVLTSVLLKNTTLATGTPSAQQANSSVLQFEGQGWATTESVSEPVDWIEFVAPFSGTSPVSDWILQASTNGGAFSQVLAVSNTGIVNATTFELGGSAVFANNSFYLAGGASPAISAGATKVIQWTTTTGTDYVPHYTGPTTFTVSGCGTAGSVTGSGTAGTFTVGTGASTCTFIFTINGATGMTATHGWIANVDDLTKNSHCTNTSGGSTTTAEVLCNFVVATSDIITFSAVAY
jgi:hypothetical protein